MSRASNTILAINNLVLGLKADGLWPKITEMYLLSACTFAGLPVKLKGTGTLTLTNFVSGDYVSAGSGAGLKGDGSTKYITTGFSPNNIADITLATYATQRGTANGRLMGMNSADPLQLVQLSDLVTSFLADIPSDNAAGGGGADCRMSHSTSSAGFLAATVRSASDRELYFNGISRATNTLTATVTTNPNPLELFRIITSPTDARQSVVLCGIGQSDTDAANLSSRINAFMTALGANVY